MIRVLFLQVALPGAAEYISQRTLAEFADHDRIEPYFVWQSHTHDPTRDQPARLPRPNQNLFLDFGRNLAIPSRPPRIGRALMMARRVPVALRRVRQHVREVRPHVIYTTQQQFDIQFGNMLAPGDAIPKIVHLHYPVGPWLGAGALRHIIRAPRVVAASDFIRQQAIEAGVRPERIVTQHEAVPLDRFQGDPGPNNLREEFGWEADAPVVISVGRLDPSKRHDLLVRAFAEVVKEVPKARLLICGGTFTRDGYDKRLQELSHSLGLQKQVVFAGARNDVPALYAQSNIFALPTEDDACPLVFQEAMASRLPAVAVWSGGVPEMVAHMETGLLSQPGDAQGLAANLLQLLRNPKLAREMGEAGLRRVNSVFTPKIAGPKWAKTVEQLLSLAPA